MNPAARRGHVYSDILGGLISGLLGPPQDPGAPKSSKARSRIRTFLAFFMLGLPWEKVAATAAGPTPGARS